MKVIRNLFPEVSKRYPSIYFKSLANRRAIEYPGSGVSAKGKPKGNPKGRACVGPSPSLIPIDLTNKNPIELYHDLALLMAAKQAGNTNTLGKANVILDKIKELNSISDKKYNKLIKNFAS